MKSILIPHFVVFYMVSATGQAPFPGKDEIKQFSFADEDYFKYHYKLGAILSFIQKHARMITADLKRLAR